jgi:hypothetical protein
MAGAKKQETKKIVMATFHVVMCVGKYLWEDENDGYDCFSVFGGGMDERIQGRVSLEYLGYLRLYTDTPPQFMA